MLLFITGAFFSCKKHSDNISVSGQSGLQNFNLKLLDTLKVKGVTVKEDSLIGNGLNYNILGTSNDPFFGIYSNSILCKLSLVLPNTDFPNTESADSAILFLPFIEGLNFYGNKTTNQAVSVQEVTSPFDTRKPVYQNFKYTTTADKSNYFGPLYFTENRTIKFLNEPITMIPGLYIKLSQTFANRLMSMPKSSYSNTDELNKEIQGICIKALANDDNVGSGGYGVFNFGNTSDFINRAKIIVYYQGTNSFGFNLSEKTSTVNVGESAGYINEITTQLNQPNSKFNLVYAQAGNSLKSKIEIEGLSNLAPGKKVVVHFASLEVFLAANSTNYFFEAPNKINLLLPIPNSIKNTFYEDQKDLSGTATLIDVGGTLNTKSNSYLFAVTRQFQKWINAYAQGKPTSPSFYLTIRSDNPITGARAVFDLSKTKIKMSYTIINE